MEQEPINEITQIKTIQRASGHKHQFISEGKQENGLVAYTCKICGYGLLVDETIDSIDNY